MFAVVFFIGIYIGLIGGTASGTAALVFHSFLVFMATSLLTMLSVH
jgi:hypothetical protein